MHSNTTLAGPVWVIVQLLVVAAIVISVFMVADALRPHRRAQASERGLPEPLWVYAGTSGVFLALLIAVQVIPGVQLGAAAVAMATPLIIVLGMVYLLRVVFPKQSEKSE